MAGGIGLLFDWRRFNCSFALNVKQSEYGDPFQEPFKGELLAEPFVYISMVAAAQNKMKELSFPQNNPVASFSFLLSHVLDNF